MKKLYIAATAFLTAALAILPMNMGRLQAAEETDMSIYFPTDIEEHWAYDEMDDFVVADLLKGYKDAQGNVTVKPDNQITRAEFVALLVRALGLTSSASGKTFADVPSDKWYYEPIRIASSLGVVNGVSDTDFGPNKLINRGDIATMVVRAFDSTVPFGTEAGQLEFDDVPMYYATEFIMDAHAAGIVNGVKDREFKPFANAKRAEAVVMLQRALDLQKGDVPNGETLKAIITEAEKQENEAINNGTISALDELYPEYYTAFQLLANRAYGDVLQELANEGYKMSVVETGTRNFEVTFASNRFAIVESTGGAYRFTYEVDGEQSVEEEPNDGLYYLKKTEDNSWKVYAIYK
ncbi:S-layer homology domain-containing protein [Paenibacillus soyae]|uniref:S-layer homology domain-containing protein n=1 Tax=Paenibacillus soyae TaxID=2969249 RepID=A0A9X2SC75_9BACL|nr:S-layer homology domain-containing protein [Paenibacillus soyae]MCR2807966.1 S-layer homology domain-containing protein [Paenibacillus soyae]